MKKIIKCSTCQDKPFCNWSANRFHFTFPNGNHISVVWGAGTYTEYHNVDFTVFQNDRMTFRNSINCEVMFDCSKRKQKEIFRHFKTEDQPLGYLTMKDFIWLFNKLSK